VSDLSSVPVLGVIAPGAEVAVAVARESDRRSGSRTPIAVLATEATVSSDAYGLAIKILDPTRNVLHVACPLFVPLAEEGWTDNEVALAAASRYLAPVASASARVVVLGCTHYPLLRATIAAALPPGTELVDSAESTARQLEMILTGDRRRDSTGPGETHLLVTDTSDRLRRVAGSFLGREEVSLELVDLP
jgi:glutamate racemase